MDLTLTKLNRKGVIGFVIPIIAGLTVWFMPAVSGLTEMGQKSLAVFLATILLFMLSPVPEAVSILAVLMVVAIAGVTSPRTPKIVELVFSGFSVPANWLIFFAFVIGVAIKFSKLGERVAYMLLSRMGRSSLGLGYGLTFANYSISPVTPSIIARGAGIFLPISDSIMRGLWVTGYTSRKTDRYITLITAMANHAVGGAFMTAATSGIVVVSLANSLLGIQIPWILWAIAAAPPTILLLVLQPYIIYKMCPPEHKIFPEIQRLAHQKLAEMGPVSIKEKITLTVFALVIGLWAMELYHGVDPALIALLGAVILLLTGTISWKDVVTGVDWNIIVCLGGFLSILRIVQENGVFEWLIKGTVMGLGLTAPIVYMVVAGGILCFIHPLFVSVSSQALVTLPVLLPLVKIVNAPPMASALLFGIVTAYAHFAPFNGSNVAYLSTGTFSKWELTKVGVTLATLGLLLCFLFLPFWRILGLL